MSGEAHWDELRPILQELTDRVARLEQLLASSGLQSTPQPASSGFAFDAAPGSPFSGTSSGGVHPDLIVLARSGNKIQAISELRRMTGMSLKDAKAAIDQALRGY